MGDRRVRMLLIAIPVLAIVAFAGYYIVNPAYSDSAGSSSAPGASSASAAPAIPADEQEALDAVAPACKESPDKLDAEAAKTVELMAEKGVHDETTVTVLRHLRQSIPDTAPVMDCTTILGPYIMMRTGGN